MIFDPAQARMVLAGRKTQTRRRVRLGETVCRYRPGGSYAVQWARSKPATGRLVVVTVAQQALGDITLRDARAEGHRTRTEFLDHWRTVFPTSRMDDRVWALVVRPDADHVRLLHRDSSRGYTSDPREAIPEEPEAIDADTLNEFANDAADRHHARRDNEPLDDRLTRALNRARSSGIDVTREHAAIARRVEAIERKTWRPA